MSKLTKDDKRNALMVFSLVKKKRCGKFKGRVVADGRKQRRYIEKESVASPTVHLESLLTTLVIDAHENRDVAILDVGGAFLLSKLSEFILIKVDDEDLVSLLGANPGYETYVNIEHGKRVLYLRLRTALYGIMQAALLWYKTYATCLKVNGFKLCKYDPCIATKMIDGKQCTIAWHVDDSKISHVDPNVVTDVINMIEKRFKEVTVSRGEHIHF